MLSKEKIEYFKEKLIKRRKDLEEALRHISQKNPNVSGDWELSPLDTNAMVSDNNEMADVFEDLENRVAIQDKLEERLTLVNEALIRIKKGTYGKCQEGGEDIEEDRLEAFPAAKNCIKHAKDHVS